MRGGKQMLKMPSFLGRGKVYFLMIASMIIMTVLFLTYFSDKLYTLSNHKVKVSIPITRRVAAADQSENKSTTFHDVQLNKRNSYTSSHQYNKSSNISQLSDLGVQLFTATSHANSYLSQQFSSEKKPGNFSTESTLLHTTSSLEAAIRNKDIMNLTDRWSTKQSSIAILTTKVDAKQSPAEHSTGHHIVDKPAPDNHEHRKRPEEHDQRLSSNASETHDNINYFQTRGTNETNKERKQVNNTVVRDYTIVSSDKTVHKPSFFRANSSIADDLNVNETLQEGSTDTPVTSVDSHVSISGAIIDNQLQSEKKVHTHDNETDHGTESPLSLQNRPNNDLKYLNKENTNTSYLTNANEQDIRASELFTDSRKQHQGIGSGAAKAKPSGKASHRFETISFKHNLLDSLWNTGNLRRMQIGTRAANTTIRPEVCRGCFKTELEQLIDSPNICDSQSDIQVLIMIASAPGNTEARGVIRNTWGKVCYDKKSAIRCVFVFGVHKNSALNKDLLEEHKLHKDMIQYVFKDVYANLTYKTMVSMKWATEKCQHAKYIMKTDDDMYVNTELLPLMLRAAPDTRFMGGFCWGPSSPHRDMSSKWYVSFEQFSQPMYPKMCSGTGYVMSYDVAQKVLKVSTDVPFFYLEDVYVSLCLKKLGIQPVLLNGFSNTKIDYDPCSYRNSIITSHDFSATELKFMWPQIQRCPRENLTPDMLYFPKLFR